MYNCAGVAFAVVVVCRLELACVCCRISLVQAMKKRVKIVTFIYMCIYMFVIVRGIFKQN